MVVLTADKFEDEVTNGKDAWLIEFYAPVNGPLKCVVLEEAWA